MTIQFDTSFYRQEEANERNFTLWCKCMSTRLMLLHYIFNFQLPSLSFSPAPWDRKVLSSKGSGD